MKRTSKGHEFIFVAVGAHREDRGSQWHEKLPVRKMSTGKLHIPTSVLRISLTPDINGAFKAAEHVFTIQVGTS